MGSSKQGAALALHFHERRHGFVLIRQSPDERATGVACAKSLRREELQQWAG